MCYRVQCSSCGKPTFAGCGAHVEQVLAGVAPEQRCQCREQRVAQTKEHPAIARILGAFRAR